LLFINKITSAALLLSIAALFVLLPLVNADSLMNCTQSGKTFVFLLGIGVVSVLSVIRFWFGLENKRSNLSTIDFLFFTFIVYVLFRNEWVELIHSLLFLELLGLALLYIIIRQQSNQSYLWILMALITGGLIQAIYGNLQLWGYYPSHHRIFKMTGSFFNPGPFSGYLAAVFPISLGLYLYNISACIPVQHPIFIKVIAWSTSLKTYFKRFSFISNFFYNNCKWVFPFEKQEEKPAYTYLTLKSFALISIISMCLVLPASRSRAAWMAVLVSSFYLIWIRYQFFEQFKIYFNTRIKKLILILTLFAILITSGAGLYHFKKGSADGRLLVWKVSSEMVKDRPVFGYGYDGFKKHYMDYQAEYFRDNPEGGEAMLAGDNNYAFNEPLQLTIEQGIIGLIPLIAIILLVFLRKYKPRQLKESEENSICLATDGHIRLSLQSNKITSERSDSKRFLLHISRAVIISIMVFGLFSYPLQILPIKICLAVALAIAANTFSRKMNLNLIESIHFTNSFRLFIKSIISVGLMGLLLVAFLHIQQVKNAYANWKNAFDLYNFGIYDDCLEDYEKGYPILKNNGDFLTNYGKALSMAEKHSEAVGVLEQAAKYYPNTIVYSALGDSYKKLGQTNQAEQAYLHAWQMNPSRFYPKYLLAKLYDETGQHEKAVAIAKELLSKEIKIESTAVKEIQEEMKKIIEEQENTQNIFNHKGKNRKLNPQKLTASCSSPFLKKKAR
jgi:O-antigen ligase